MKPVTVSLAIEFDPALTDDVAWHGTLSDSDGGTLATFEGGSAHDICFAAARVADGYVAGQVKA